MTLPGVGNHMGLLGTLRRAVGIEPSEELYTYECQACHEMFEVETSEIAEVTCPNCGDHNVRARRTP